MRIVNVVELFARHDPAAVAFVCGDETQTYGDLAAQVAAARSALVERLTKRNAVVVLGEASIRFVDAVLAAVSAGLPVLPMHPRLPRSEILRAIDLADPKLVISTDVASESVASALAVEHVPAQELFEHSGEPVSPVELGPDDPALLMFTSGTAGAPRIAVLSHRNVAASIAQSRASAPETVTGEHTILGVMPLTHVLGIVSVVAVAVTVGATVVLTEKSDIESIVDQVETHGVTFLVAPPVFWFRLAESDVEPARLASVTATLSGAAPLSASVASRVQARYGLRLRQGYGLTEASPGLSSALGTDAPATSVGRPLPGVTLRLVDESGADVLVGDVGEIWARGDNVFAGYLGDPEATASVIDTEGWLHTGDLALVNDLGFLFIVGRNRDLIVVSGFNVFPGEVEDRLVEHHTVEAAAVVGEPDEEYGELIVAFVVPARGMEPDADVLEAHCRTKLAGYKVPSRFEFVAELPRGVSGKVQRRMLRN